MKKVKAKFRLLLVLLTFFLVASSAIFLGKDANSYTGLPNNLSGKVYPAQKTGVF